MGANGCLGGRPQRGVAGGERERERYIEPSVCSEDQYVCHRLINPVILTTITADYRR